MLKFKIAGWRALVVMAALGLPPVACQGPEPFYRTTSGEGGSVGAGGSGSGGSLVTGSGGTIATGTGGKGGTTGTGGTIVTGTGGKGGTTGTGGTPATGGTTGTGGKGGTTGTGGTVATGGVTGTGGTTGAGGTIATGGTTGAGGTTATGGATGTGGAAGCTGCKVVVDTDCQSGTSTQTINLYLDVLNNSSTQIPLSQVTFRYYFQLAETSDPPHLDIDYSAMGLTADITTKFVAISPAVTGANEYMEVGFISTAPTLAMFSDTGQLQLRLHATSFANPFDSSQTTDYSFQSCAAGQTANTGMFNTQTTITAYINGVLSSGVEPQ